MKVDRFVRVMLVLIAVLLTLNCVKNFSNSSDSPGNSNRSPGSSRTPIIESTVEAAPPPPQYKAVGAQMMNGSDANAVQRGLDQMSAQGWEYVGSADEVLIFKK
jgi:hypothetical protein